MAISKRWQAWDTSATAFCGTTGMIKTSEKNNIRIQLFAAFVTGI